MTKDEVFRIWAPQIAPWARWVKPVLFSHVGVGRVSEADAREGSESALARVESFGMQQIVPSGSVNASYRTTARVANVAVIVDLPGATSVEAGMTLARLGFRPIPLFNAYPAVDATPVVDVWPIIHALERATPELAARSLPADAPPAFLLDGARRGDGPTLWGSFDNRSSCSQADFPTSAELAKHGFEHVVVVHKSVAKPLERDLQNVLLSLQKGGRKIHVTALDASAPAAITVPRLSFFAHLAEAWYQWSLQPRDEAGFGRRHTS